MANLTVNSPEVKKVVEDYDIILSSGQMLPLTIDITAGDKVTWKEHTLEFDLVSRPNINDDSIMLPAEKLTVFRGHIMTIQHRQREVLQLSPEQKALWSKTLQEMGGKVQ